MELYRIRYFLALCETLNFARAAEQCRVSQPSLTRAVQKLERELGGLLVRRERRRTHLTGLGELVRPMLEEVLRHAERTIALAALHRQGGGKTIKLGFMPSIGPQRFAPFLARFSRTHPDVELQLVDAALASLYDQLFSGTLDAAVTAYAKRTDKLLRHIRLYKERLMCAMPRGHPFEQADAVRLRDLKGEHFLARTHCENGSLLMENCRRQGFELNIRYRSAREDWIQAMVAAGCGVTIIPEFSRIGRRIALRPIAEPALFRELSITTVAGRPHDTALRALLRELRAHKWENDDMPAGEGGRAAASPVQVLTLPGDETVDASG